MLFLDWASAVDNVRDNIIVAIETETATKLLINEFEWVGRALSAALWHAANVARR